MKRATDSGLHSKNQSDKIFNDLYRITSMEFADLCDVFRNHCAARGLSTRTMDAYSFHLKRFGLWLQQSSIPVTKITHHTMDKFSTDLQNRISEATGKPLSRAGINSTLRTCRVFFNYICDCPELWNGKPNPTLKIGLLNENDRKKEKMLEPEDIERLLRACNTRTYCGFRNFLAILFLWGTGCRLNELLTLQRKDINLEVKIKGRAYGFCKVVRKGGRTDTIKLGDKLREKMFIFAKKVYEGSGKKDWPIESDYFFTSKDGKPILSRNFQHILDRIAKKAKLEIHIHPHLFRKSAACYLVKQGKTSGRAIQERFGWRSETMLRHYTASLKAEDLWAEMDRNCPDDGLRI